MFHTPPSGFRTVANSRFLEDWALVGKLHSSTLPTGIYIVGEFYTPYSDINLIICSLYVSNLPKDLAYSEINANL